MAQEKNDKIRAIMSRKEEHIKICLDKPVQSKDKRTLFNNVQLINDSLPELDYDEIDISADFLGHKFSAPIMAGAMTGGAESAKKINENIAVACEELGLGMAVGSQRAALYDKVLEETYSITRKSAPNIFIGANIGGAQISKGFPIGDARRLIEMLDANALYVHLNPAQEIVQPEGEPSYKNVMSGIKEMVKGTGKPVIAKEVGFGISGNAAKKLESIGVSAIEVAGMGGTSYTAVEWYRAKEMKMRSKEMLGNLLWDWGIPTAASLYSVKHSVMIPIVSSGGIRTGLDIAKSIAMGASMSAVALPLLRPATVSSDAVKEAFENLIYELKAAMFITGCKNIEELKHSRYVITGELKDWISGMSDRSKI